MSSRRIESVLAVSLWLVLAGCGPVEEPLAEPSTEEVTAEQALSSQNGLSFNGLSFNGLSFNGLSFNGLSFNGLSSAGFGAWFNLNPVMADMVMRYVVRCAVPAGQVRHYTNPRTQRSYSWEGLLGLAPDWAQGAPATTAEQQVVSACLAAHTTNTGVQMAISVLGVNARGQAIPYDFSELSTFSAREACFFGNLFTGEGLYVASDQGLLRGNLSSPRGCALSPGPFQRVDENCPPIVPLGSCDAYCTRGLLSPFHTSCTRNGIQYRPITTRLRSQDVFRCGDGVCQYTESCGLGVGYRDCSLDCGICIDRDR
ncbi:hypothetical protein ACLESD_09635 [Pyxidicoccus sp. 3LFB2]